MSVRLRVAGFLAAALAAAPAGAEPKAFDQLRAAAKPPGQAPYLEATLRGTLTHVCGRNDAFAWAWILRASDATLFDERKRKIGIFAMRVAVIPPPHDLLTRWDGTDGGNVVATLEARAQLPGDVRVWERYSVQSRTGARRFTLAKSILRISTAWRVRPPGSCNQSRSGAVSRMPYAGTVLLLN